MKQAHALGPQEKALSSSHRDELNYHVSVATRAENLLRSFIFMEQNCVHVK